MEGEIQHDGEKHGMRSRLNSVQLYGKNVKNKKNAPTAIFAHLILQKNGYHV